MISVLWITLSLMTHHTYQVDGIQGPPRFTHQVVNQPVHIYSQGESWMIDIRLANASRTPLTAKADRILDHVISLENGDCVEKSGKLCELLQAEEILCRPISGFLYVNRFPASRAHLYVPAIHGVPHRWVEYFDPEQGWIAVDPTQPAGKISLYHVPVPVNDNWPDIRVKAVSWD